MTSSAELSELASRLSRSPLANADWLAQVYLEVLGRFPDASGFAHGMRALERGVHRQVLLRNVVLGPEAQARLGAHACNWLADRWRPAALARWWSRVRRGRTGPARTGGWLAVPGGQAGSRPPDAEPEAAASGQEPVPAGAGLTVVTIAAANYAPRVRLLMRSVARHLPDAHRVWVVVEPKSASVPDGGPGTERLWAQDVCGPELADMSWRYDTLELSTALKPFALRQILARPGARAVVYLDPDIELYAGLEDALAATRAGATFVVTPHALEPQPGPGLPDDLLLLRCGAFNLGFLTVAASEESHRLLEWWAEQLTTRCRVAFDEGLFTDQRWCDLLPAYAAGLHVLRHPGYNVAYWNLNQRQLTEESPGHWRVGEVPLVAFHFSGFDPREPEKCSRHQTRLSEDDIRPALPLLRGYAARLLAETAADPEPAGPLPGLDRLSDGSPVPSALRAWYRHLHPQPSRQPRAQLEADTLSRALEPGEDGLPRLVQWMRETIPELQSAFPPGCSATARHLCTWLQLAPQGRQWLGAMLVPQAKRVGS